MTGPNRFDKSGVATLGQKSRFRRRVGAAKSGVAGGKAAKAGDDLLVRAGVLGHAGVGRHALLHQPYAKRLILGSFGMFKRQVKKLAFRFGRAQVPARVQGCAGGGQSQSASARGIGPRRS